MDVNLQPSTGIVLGLLFAGLVVGCGQSKTEEMMEYLEVENDSRREAACMRLGMMGSDASKAYDNVLEHYRNDPSRAVRANCLEALGQIGGREGTVNTLIGALDVSADEIKLHALRGLGDLGSSEAIPAIIKLLDDDNPEVREASASALQHIGDPDVLPTLRRHLKNETNQDVEDAIENAILIIDSSNS